MRSPSTRLTDINTRQRAEQLAFAQSIMRASVAVMVISFASGAALYKFEQHQKHVDRINQENVHVASR